MTFQKTTVLHYRITDIADLDPIDVFVENYSVGSGRITISCYDTAWTNSWNAMGGRTLQDFFRTSGEDYLLNKLKSEYHKKMPRLEKWLKLIIAAIKDAFAADRT